ncbi:MAG: MMPL family transporter [Firmicutes bacterium]|nr:MMPL family transporter [Bacillota bacterium]
MLKFGRTVTKNRKIILIIGLLLLIPSVFGFINTRVNYDVLLYLPDTMETVRGQDILLDEFNKGGFSMVMVDGMKNKDVAELKQKIEQVDHVDSVIWYDSILDLSTPMDILPNDIKNKFNDGETTMMAVFFDSPTSDDNTLVAVNEIRDIGGKQCFVSGMSAFVADLKNVAEAEEPIYVGIAVILAVLVMALLLDSWLISVVFVLGIGITILYNMGSNIFFGDISYITKAIAAVLQLAVTMDYSIFLWHSYKEHRFELGLDREEAMANAIAKTLQAITGSSITTIAGFLALCFMTFTLGLNLGIVMAKGVLLGVIGSVTVLPALILLFEKPILKTKHKPLLPKFDWLSDKVTKRPAIWIIVFLALLGPALFGYTHTSVYYNLDASVPQDLPFRIANNKLYDEFGMNTELMILSDAKLKEKDSRDMIEEINKVDGVIMTLSLESGVGPTVPEAILPGELEGMVKSDNWELMMVGSEYAVASDELNKQIDTVNAIMDKYDKKAMLIGEGPCTKDLIDVTDHDFKVVTAVSVAAIFFIIFFVLQSITLPIILVSCIELAIFINLGIPYFTGTVMSFIDSICISTIQLGATVDYAILMTTRYKQERNNGLVPREAMKIAHSRSMTSIAVSALGFFAATIGVSIYSNIDIISSMTLFMARGALVSSLVVMFILPSMLVLFDKIIIKTSLGFEKVEGAFHYRKVQLAEGPDKEETIDV